MTEPLTCERCGGPLPAAGPCPRCLIELGFETAGAAGQGLYRMDGRLAEGTMIGSYRIIRLIGEGGMGVVYEAGQELPRRTVALKVIRPGLVTPELLRRFELEAQALGRLQHPGIA